MKIHPEHRWAGQAEASTAAKHLSAMLFVGVLAASQAASQPASSNSYELQRITKIFIGITKNKKEFVRIHNDSYEIIGILNN